MSQTVPALGEAATLAGGRRGRDLNPREGCALYLLSRQARSTRLRHLSNGKPLQVMKGRLGGGGRLGRLPTSRRRTAPGELQS